MNISERFQQYAQDFELTKADDNWGRVKKHFHVDASRREYAPPILDLDIQGRDNIMAQWQEMVTKFDRYFPYAFVMPLGAAKTEGSRVFLRWIGIYALDDAPVLFGEGLEIADYEGDRIKHLETTMTQQTVARNIEWYGEYAGKLPDEMLEYAGTLAPQAEEKR